MGNAHLFQKALPDCPWPSLQGLCSAFQSPTLSYEAPHADTGRVQFPSPKGTLEWVTVSLDLSVPARARRRALGAVAALGSSGQAPPCQLGLPPAAAGVAMVICKHSSTPPPCTPTRQPLTLGPGPSRDRGSWVSWKRFPSTRSGLSHWLDEPAGKGHPQGHC